MRESPVAPTLLLVLGLSPARPALAQEPPSFLRKVVGLTEAQVAAVAAGQVVTRQLPTTDKPEMAAFGVVRVNADQATFLARLRDVASFRRGPSVREIGRFQNPPTVADLEGLTLEEGDFEAARRCKPGDCDIKMARSAMERVHREIKWSAGDAKARTTALMKTMLVEYAAAYMQGGTPEMATYNDNQKPLETSAEFRKALSASPYLIEYAPELHRHVEEFPKGALAGAEDLFYWAKDKFGPKPTISIYHVTIWKDPKDPGRAVIASKQIYASHYFQAGFDVTALLDAPPGQTGFYLMDFYRGRIDPPTGMLAGVILGKIRGGIEEGVAESLRTAKAKAEAK